MAYFVKISYLDLYSPRFKFKDGPPSFYDYPKPLYRGKTLSSEDVATYAEEESKFKSLPDFINIYNFWVVSDRFRKVSEEFEPGVHQYFPVTLKRGVKGVAPEMYYLLNIRRSADAIIYEESDVIWTGENLGFAVPHFSNTKPKILLDKTKIENSHMWHGDTFFHSEIFFSDEFYKAVKRCKLKKLDAIYAEEK